MPTIAVTPGAVNITITGSFSSSYQAFASANWPTELPIINKTATSFDIDPFTMPAPAGAFIDWFVVGGVSPGPASAVTLSYYLSEVRRLLRDKTTTGAQVIWSDEDLTAFVNRAMQQRDLDLGLNRSLIRFAMTTGVFRYPFAAIVAGGTVIDGVALPNLIDMLSVTVYSIGPSPTGGTKYPLARQPYSFVNRFTSTSWMSYPRWYAIFGPGSVYVAPPPAQAYLAEWDAKGFATGLVSTTDQDPMPYPYTDPIPFGAAGFAYLESKNYPEADYYLSMDPKKPLGLFPLRMGLVRSGSRPFAVKDPFFDYPRR